MTTEPLTQTKTGTKTNEDNRFIKNVPSVATVMRRALIICCLLVLIGFTGTGNVSARQAEDSGSGPLFGGQWTWANNSSSQTSELSSLPAIAEDYTATWCTNCVKVEDVLQDLDDEGTIKKYHFHRNNDHEDPFGSNNTEEHYKQRYGTGAPPIVVFNGTVKQIGSSPNSDSLETDYRTIVSQSLALTGNTTFTWTEQGNNSGIVSWAIDIDLTQYDDYEMSVNAWIVEDSAEFKEGSNGKEIYPNIVKKIINLGSEKIGTSSIDIPEAFDGDDLQIHLMYHFTPLDNYEGDNTIDNSEDDEKDDSLPSISAITSIMIVISAAIIRKS